MLPAEIDVPMEGNREMKNPGKYFFLRQERVLRLFLGRRKSQLKQQD